MSENQSKQILLALSAVGSLALALRSRRSKQKLVNRAKRRALDGQFSTENDASTSNTQQQEPEQPPLATNSQSSSSIALVLHGIFSILLLSTATFYHPPCSPDPESWRKTLGSILILLFTLHLLKIYLSLFSRSCSRRRNNNDPPSQPSQQQQRNDESAASISQLNGVWIKDKIRSDSWDPVCELMQLGGLLRMAIGLIKGVEIHAVPGETFHFDVLSGVLWFKIKEKYKLSGEEARHRRRDFRGGGSFGSARPAPEGGVEIAHHFGAPMPGIMKERFYCLGEDVLFVDTFIKREEQPTGLSYRQVYIKKRRRAEHAER